MTFIGSIHGGSFSPAIIFNNHKPPLRHRHQRPPTPPIFISTNLSDINPNNLRDLCTTCNHSFHRFPNISPDGKVEPVDVDKLRTAVSHSSVVVSVFARSELVTGGGDWYRRMIPLTPVTGELVGFGRAVGDDALTASIYDVMVTPRLQGRGIGRMILQRIIRKFFKACGFGDDMLGSTTMMYTRRGSDLDVSAGRKLLMVPPFRKP
ncbi:putative transcription regulator GNAT family [Helianthus annuus]|nr:putative transcription regulator GNAT family [Helianthus annuus]